MSLGTWHLISTKSGKGRRVRLTQRAAALKDHRKRQLEERIRQGGLWQDKDLVFPNEAGSWSIPPACVTAHSSVLKLAPASGKTYASTISATPAPRCYSVKESMEVSLRDAPPRLHNITFTLTLIFRPTCKTPPPTRWAKPLGSYRWCQSSVKEGRDVIRPFLILDVIPAKRFFL